MIFRILVGDVISSNYGVVFYFSIVTKKKKKKKCQAGNPVNVKVSWDFRATDVNIVCL